VSDDPDRDDPFLATSCRAMRASTGAEALDALGWWDLLPHLDDDDARAAVFAAFRAQGRELGGRPRSAASSPSRSSRAPTSRPGPSSLRSAVAPHGGATCGCSWVTSVAAGCCSTSPVAV
jgi:hypothetical protein